MTDGKWINDVELIDWLESTRAQTWYERGKWTLFLRFEDQNPIQPTALTWRMVVLQAKTEYERRQALAATQSGQS